MTTYLQINFRDGKLFQYSANKKEGFEEHFNKEGVQKGYRKYYSFITGELLSIRERENNKMNNRKELNVTFKVDDDIYVVVFNVFNQKKSFDTFLESFITQMPFLKKGETYTLKCYNFKNESGNEIIGTTLTEGGVDGEKVERLRQRYKRKDGTVTEGVIPEVHWSQKRGSWVLDNDAQQDYLFNVYEQALEELAGELKFDTNAIKPSKSVSTEKTTKEDTMTPVKEEIKAHYEEVHEIIEEDDDDELPF